MLECVFCEMAPESQQVQTALSRSIDQGDREMKALGFGFGWFHSCCAVSRPTASWMVRAELLSVVCFCFVFAAEFSIPSTKLPFRESRRLSRLCHTRKEGKGERLGNLGRS